MRHNKNGINIKMKAEDKRKIGREKKIRNN
jgi:hypothetical protein